MKILANYSVPSYRMYNNVQNKQNSSNVSFGNNPGLNPLDPLGRLASESSYTYDIGSSGSSSSHHTSSSSSSSSSSYDYSGFAEEYDRQCKELEEGLRKDGITINDIYSPRVPLYVVNMDIHGENYKFLTSKGNRHAIMLDIAGAGRSYDNGELAEQVRNVKDRNKGRFVKVNGEEHFVPRLKDGRPDPEKDTLLVQYGNAEEDRYSRYKPNSYSETAIAKEVGSDFDRSKLTRIEYLEKLSSAYLADLCDNTIRKRALGYYDEKTDTNYIFFEDTKTVEKAKLSHD